MSKNKKMDAEEVLTYLKAMVKLINPGDLETDNNGQLIIYTGIIRGKDGNYYEGEE